MEIVREWKFSDLSSWIKEQTSYFQCIKRCKQSLFWQVHFDEGLLARQQSGEGTKGVTKASRGKLPSQKLTEEELIKFTARVAVQV